MCGLAGIARHPDAGLEMTTSILLLEDLLRSIENRGRHATGVAVEDKRKSFVWKWAVPASTALRSPAWEKVAAGIRPSATILLGHTRHATQPNAKQDDAAHPFKIGKVVGAHNGIIYNWRDIEGRVKPKKAWQVDSEAAIALLNRHKDPVEALDQLSGYWALTWIRDGKLYACRTSDAQLSMAYVPAMRTLVWNSRQDNLQAALHGAGLAFESWELRAGVIYEYDPAKFDETGTHAIKAEGAFTARGGGRVSRADLALTSGGQSGGSFSFGTPAFGGVSTSTTGARGAKRIRRREEVIQDSFFERGANQTRSTREIVEALEKRLADCEAEVERLSAEYEHLASIVEDAGLLEYSHGSARRRLQHALRLIGPGDDDRCVVCGEGGSTLIDGADGRIHEDCIFLGAR